MNPNCVERRDSTVAPQALHLMNNGMVHRLAEHFAQRVSREAGDRSGRSHREVYWLATEPTAERTRRRRLGLLALSELAVNWAKHCTDRKAERNAADREGTDNLLSRDHELGGFPVCGLRAEADRWDCE